VCLAGEPPAPTEARGADARRRDQLVRTFKKAEGDAWLRTWFRALDELALEADFDVALWKTVEAKLARHLERYAKDDWAVQLPPLWLVALTSPGKAVVPTILGRLRADSTSPTEAHLLLLILGRMGPAAKGAMPFLRKQLADPKTPRARKAQIRVVLANLGDGSKDTAAAILADLKKRETSYDVLQTMASIGPRNWVTEGMIRAMAKEATLDAALVLGLLGERAGSVAKKLDDLQRSTVKDGLPDQFIYGLALARIDRKNQDTALRRLFPKDFTCHPLGLLALFNNHPPEMLVDAEISKHLGKLVGDKDRTVSGGALMLLEQTGLSARGAAPAVLAFLRSDADVTRRGQAARALARIADYSLLPELKAVAEKEASVEVCERLEATIKLIELVEPKKQ